MGLLTCTKCKQRKPKTLKYFPPHNKKSNGLDSWCRNCRATYRNGINRGKFRNVISDEDLANLKSSIKQCVICGVETTKLVVDHCHKTGSIRGLLCTNCNLGLGHFKDDPLLLEFAIQYLHANADSEKWVDYYNQHS